MNSILERRKLIKIGDLSAFTQLANSRTRTRPICLYFLFLYLLPYVNLVLVQKLESMWHRRCHDIVKRYENENTWVQDLLCTLLRHEERTQSRFLHVNAKPRNFQCAVFKHSSLWKYHGEPEGMALLSHV